MTEQQSYLLSDLQINTIFSSLPPGTVDWVLADKEHVFYTSPNAQKTLGISLGMLTGDNPLLERIFETKTPFIQKKETEQGEPEIIHTIGGIPLKEVSGQVKAALLYMSGEDANVVNSSNINKLLRKMTEKKDLGASLKVFTQYILERFKADLAGVWVWDRENFKLAALSSWDTEEEMKIKELVFPIKYCENLLEKEDESGSIVIHEFHEHYLDIPKDSRGPFYRWSQLMAELGIPKLLCVPLIHIKDFLGVITLFSHDSDAFDAVSNMRINQLVPVISSFIYEQQMRMAAIEREQDLNLLLWGTEILVQADSEEQLLTEAGEMAMVLNLEAGFFLMKKDEGWEISAPFGRLKQNDSGWEKWIFDQIDIDFSEGYNEHKTSTLHFMNDNPMNSELPWETILIQPIQTHRGIIGELWLLDFVEKAIEQRQEIFAAFARGLGVALETISQRKELERLATTDSLTEIFNRQGFERRIQEEMASVLRRGSSFTFLVLDLDGFKGLNDSQGHPVGDRALRTLAKNLRNTVRENDIVARTGGDEFTVVLTDLKKGKEALMIIQRMKNKMGLEEFGLGVSIGAAEYPGEADNYESLYRLADQRLYHGKFHGKGKIIMGEDIDFESQP